MHPISYVHLIGDSTLDNLHRITNSSSPSDISRAKGDCIEGQLQTKLGKAYQVVNHTYVGITTSGVLNRNMVRGGNPLKKLQAKINENNTATHYVVISVGRNDFYALIQAPWLRFSEIPRVQELYLEIVQKVQKMGSKNIKPILMFQYRTDARDRSDNIYTVLGGLGYVAAALNTFAVYMIVCSAYRLMTNKVSLAGFEKLFLGGAFLYVSYKKLSLRVTKEIFTGKHAGIAVFGALLESFYQPILKKAMEDSIPILDLPNLFDPKNPNNYIDGTEPSIKGGAFIAHHLVNIIEGYREEQEKVSSFQSWTVKAL